MEIWSLRIFRKALNANIVFRRGLLHQVQQMELDKNCSKDLSCNKLHKNYIADKNLVDAFECGVDKMKEQSELNYFAKEAAVNMLEKIERPGSSYTKTIDSAPPTSQWTKPLILAGCASTMGLAVPIGYCIGVVNSPAVHMRSWSNDTLIQRYDLHLSSAAIDILWSIIVSVLLVGATIGSFVGAWTANKYGRKGTVLICGILFFIGGILFFTCRWARSVEMLIIGRFSAGLAAGLTTATLPMYQTEIAPLSLRGTLGVFSIMGMTSGIVIAQIASLQIVFGSAEHWHLALSFYVLLLVISLAPFHYFPESPKWLYIVKGSPELAHKELLRLRGNASDAVIEQEIRDMEIESSVQGQSSSFLEVIKDRTLLLPLFIVCVYQCGQQFSGINAIFFYSVSIFRQAGLSASAAEWANLGAGLVNLASSLMGPILMARVNRRTLMQFSTASCAVALLLFAILTYFMDLVSWFAYGSMTCIFLYIFFFHFGLAPIPFFIASELFEVSPRPVAMALGSLTSWSSNFIIGMTFPSFLNIMGALVFVPFSVICILLFVLTKYYLPETRGRDPSIVAPLMTLGFKSKVHVKKLG